ncbi:MAG: CvpA family protein [Paludibacteraceae bacterium]|nr:CvpA family protein [Paludibacteraceae bacterium]
MSYLDIIILLPILFGIIMGVKRGVVMEIFAIVGIILGIVVSRIYAGDAAEWLQQVSQWDVNLLKPIAAFALFVLVAIACRLLSLLLTKLFKLIALGWLNRLIGGLFGAVKWILILAVIVTCIDMLDGILHFIKPELKENSVLYPLAIQLTQSIKSMIIH